MHLQVSCLGIMEDLTNIVDRSLYSPDPPRGYGASISIGSGVEGSWPLGPEGTTGSRDLVACWLSGPEVGFRIWDPEASWSSGPEGASGSWDPMACWLSGPEVGSGS
jgi:hypothetical protein